MSQGLKRDQISPVQYKALKHCFEAEKELSFDVEVGNIVLHKTTYKKLVSDNENRIRIYFGLENKNQQNVICAFAVSAFLMGSGDVFVDYEVPVFKLNEQNEDFSSKTGEVVKCIQSYRKWLDGKVNSGNKFANVRKYIYPKGFLFAGFELHEIFNNQQLLTAQINLGIKKNLTVLVSSADSEDEVFGVKSFCPPLCDDKSIYNKGA